MFLSLLLIPTLLFLLVLITASLSDNVHENRLFVIKTITPVIKICRSPRK
jgi:hypothetical protein